MKPRDTLPEFDDPPVNEVILSVQFAPLSEMTSAHVGIFWNSVRSKYPKLSETGPVAPVFETFGSQMPMQSGIQIQLNAMLKPPMPRFWLEDASGTELLQIQNDHLYHNWRQQGEARYPRYKHVREQFAQDFGAFSHFLADEKLGEIKPNQCDVSYINVITLDADVDPHKEMARILTFWKDWPETKHLPHIENALIQMRTILSRSGSPVCRLYIKAQPVFIISTGKPAIQMELVSRGKPDGESTDDVLSLLDFSHVGIVNTFAAMTTQAMHKKWRRRIHAR